MKNFAKSILNYFATYNETRFRFGKKVPYAWTNDEFTLNFSAFPDFEQDILCKIKTGSPFSIHVQTGEYQVRLDAGDFRARMLNALENDFDERFLQSCLSEAEEQLTGTTYEVDEEGEVSEQKDNPEADPDLQRNIRNEGFRSFDLALRKEISDSLMRLQEEKKSDVQKRLGISNMPVSSFNPQSIEQEIFED